MTGNMAGRYTDNVFQVGGDKKSKGAKARRDSSSSSSSSSDDEGKKKVSGMRLKLSLMDSTRSTTFNIIRALRLMCD